MNTYSNIMSVAYGRDRHRVKSRVPKIMTGSLAGTAVASMSRNSVRFTIKNAATVGAEDISPSIADN